ncbi:MAG: hypothetical protein ACRDGS_03165, partial [Chloroflexota bacterium]
PGTVGDALMIRGFVDLCTVAYVVIDDLYRAHLAPLAPRPGPAAGCTDSELITLTLVAELVGLDNEVAFLAYVRRNHPSLFPALPERRRPNRPRNRPKRPAGAYPVSIGAGRVHSLHRCPGVGYPHGPG